MQPYHTMYYAFAGIDQPSARGGGGLRNHDRNRRVGYLGSHVENDGWTRVRFLGLGREREGGGGGGGTVTPSGAAIT